MSWSLLRRAASLAIAVLTSFSLTLAGCSDDEQADAAPAKGTAAHAKPKRRATKPSSSGRGGDVNAESDLRSLLGKKPSSCDAGKNTRKVNSVKVGDQKKYESSGGQYLKATGSAVITESGPCPGSGQHTWKVGVTYISEGGKWRLTSFGVDQTLLK